MIKSTALVLVVFSSISLYGQTSNRAKAAAELDRASEDLTRVMSWLPADTETITVARGPFMFAGGLEESDGKDRAISNKELDSNFEELPLALLWFKHGLLAKRLGAKRINFA